VGGQGQGSGAQKVIYVPYTVQQGDTLFGIAQYHIDRGQPTSVALMAKHGIGSGKLVAGKTLNIPVANPAYCPGLHTYVVLEGDNAFRIAMKYNVNVEWLRQNNNLDSNYTVYVTDILCVP
jgi:LysM repeat protein